MLRLLSGALLCCAFAFSQTPTGELTGSVLDPGGAGIAGARITVTNNATNTGRTTVSNEVGLYNVPALQPGVYSVRAESQGFQSVLQTNLEIQVGQTVRLDFSLKVGEVKETVEVTASAVQLQTETTELGTVIENKRIVDLPLNGRNYLQLASLVPGATTNGPASSQGQQRMGGARNQFALNVAGQRVHFNHYTLDGVENTDPNFNTYLMLPSIDALQEFKVESGIFQAEYGRAMAQVNVSTKSGTNEFHGAFFEFLRNSRLDAKNYFDRGELPIPPFKRNQFGATFSGPAIKNKLFGLFSYEGLRERKALTSTGVVPNAQQRAGDFSFFSGTIMDPATRVVENNRVTSETPFPGNRIPANRIQALSRRVLNDFYPLSNLTGPNNFINNEGRRQTNDQYHARADFARNTSDNWFFRYSQSGDLGYIPAFAPNMGNNVDVDVKQAVLANTRLLGTNKVNEFRFAVNRMVSQNIQQRANTTNVVADLGIPDVDTSIPLFWGIPFFQINGFSSIGECNDCPFVNWNTTFQLTDNLSWTRGRHQFKMGGEYRRLRYNQIGAVVPRGRFTFSGQYTGPNGSGGPNNGMADYLLGLMSNTEGQVGAPIANYRNYYMAFYLQDTWKVTNRLTMNWGIRYEAEPPYLDKHDAIVNIDYNWDDSRPLTFVRAGTGDPYAGNPPFRLPSSIPYVRDGRFGRRAYKPDWNDFGPRLGIAYQINDKTVLRSGAGIYYVRDIGNAVFDIVRNAPFTIRRNEAANALISNLNWARPFSITGAPTFILANQWNEPTSYVNQWSFGVQREITKSSNLEVTYLGSTGVKLRRLASYNDPQPGPGNIQQRRPFPLLGNVQVMHAPANSNYNALHVRLQQRYSSGFTLLSSYAWGKSIDTGSGIRTTDGDTLITTNQRNLRSERGLSAFDFRHRWTNSFLYELPFGRGRALGSGIGRAANLLIGGWNIGGIFTLQGGFPATAYCGGGLVQNGGSGCYPDSLGVSPQRERGSQDPRRWFDTGAFTDRIGVNIAGGQAPTDFRFGNSARNTIIGPGLINIDASLNKNFNITERHRLEFRFEVFNAPNHPNWGQPGTTLRTPTYGVITGTRTDPRDIQLALKYYF